MTMLPRAVAIFAATEPIDMRRSFDRLAAATRETLGQDPRSGALFLFVNRAADRLKVLSWDRTGYCILYKRLERGTFRMPSAMRAREASVTIDAAELGKILEGIELSPTKQRVRASMPQETPAPR
jgi:transposase